MPLIKEKSSFTPEMKKDPENSNTLNSAPEKKPSGLVTTIGSLLPLAPVFFEQWTGQKIPPLTGTLAEMNNSLSTLSLTLQQVLNNQQQIYQTVQQLQTAAQSSLTHLAQQVSQIQNIRLAHSRETKSIEYNQPRPEKDFIE